MTQRIDLALLPRVKRRGPTTSGQTPAGWLDLFADHPEPTVSLADASRSGAIRWFGADDDDEPPRATETSRAETDDAEQPSDREHRDGGSDDAEPTELGPCACDWPAWAAPCPDHPRLEDIDTLADLQAGYAHAPRTATGLDAAELLDLLEQMPTPTAEERRAIERLAQDRDPGSDPGPRFSIEPVREPARVWLGRVAGFVGLGLVFGLALLAARHGGDGAGAASLLLLSAAAVIDGGV